mmetsp:Transcript_38068/g.84778  ORF Transcript_38068/g.84778 Transcript_38068/m.84778 type:complete len:321 (-) Transcript_38068:542-1504(-)|eukprot:CAMPEP_0202891070 /NCGR_PEP_ID=MMETSP1392-20130828/1252_1 /ASSEMBLY_ACC=CAM_ASM_000868 /TAXON_ID=225041 /ORGANISM="Chlamydomonas chlamydogama, Strain SAG 11-48b" /LENGTH=320 /DNA_ID=CAMNT_0049574743 /DNA_START=102 /DNA_END=1064 /DNA_ORIENTATION=+
MGKGQRHSKNAGVMGAEGLTYAERRALGFGTVKERLGKDSLGNYYDCCLTLQPAVDPVITPEGYLYSKEAILENLLAQKKTLKKKLAAWEAAQEEEKKKELEQQAISQQAEIIAFDRANHMGISQQTVESIKTAIEVEAAHLANPVGGAASVMNIKENEERAKTMKAFWMPYKAPSAKEVVEKPSLDTMCPASGKKLKLKELIPVKFTPVPEGDAGRHMDPLTRETFGTSSKLVVLKGTGDVVLKETWEKLIKPEGVFNGHRIREKEVIELQTGGTGFAARDGEKVQTQKHFALGPGSGRQDLRGQHQGPRSLGGLNFMN